MHHMKKIAYSSILALAFIPISVNAIEIDSISDTSTGGSATTETTERYAITFTGNLGYNYSITQIQLYSYKTNTGNVICETYATDVNHKPTGSYLEQSTFNITGSTSWDWEINDYTGTYEYIDNTEYSLSCYPETDTFTFHWHTDSNYHGQYSNNSGSTWTPTDEYNYRIYGTEWIDEGGSGTTTTATSTGGGATQHDTEFFYGIILVFLFYFAIRSIYGSIFKLQV